MRHERAGAKSSNGGFRDLDALVLAEIESLSGRRRDAKPHSQGERLARLEEPQVGATRERRDASAQVASIQPGARDAPNRSGEEFDGIFDESSERDATGPEADDAVSEASLLSTEEEAFVTRAVGFLSQREHADMILGRIWEQLTELDPQGFYEAPVSPTSAQPTASSVEGAEQPPPRDEG